MDYFTDKVDMIIDNAGWDVPATACARKYLNQRKARGHSRTRLVSKPSAQSQVPKNTT